MRKKGGGTGTIFKNRTRKPSHARENDSGMQSALFIFAAKRRIQNKMTVHVETSILELNQENVLALAHYEPQVCGVGEHLLHDEPQVFAVGGHLLLESNTENVEDPPRPAEQELIVKASQEARFSKKRSIMSNCSGQDYIATLTEDGLHPLTINLTNRDLLAGQVFQS